MAVSPARAFDVAAPFGAATRRLALALMVASGCAALGCQIVWTQQSATWLGHETAAVLAVVAAFFGGLAIGAHALGSRIDRSARPARWYAACEAAIGVWTIALAVLIAPVSRALLGLVGPQPSPAWQWTVAFCGTFLLLLPATAAMGATLPALERLLSPLRRQRSPIAALYAGNTFGAVLGVLGAAFWLVPQFGLTRTAVVCAMLNLACAALAIALFKPSATGDKLGAPATHSAGVLALLAATGLLGIGYEVLVVRVLSQVAENTVYTFALLLAVYLVGTALGAALYARPPTQSRADDRAQQTLLWLLAAACLFGTATLWAAAAVRDAVRHALGAGMASALAAEAALALAAFLLPTIAMGALFGHLCSRARNAGIAFGRSIGANTLGAALAPVAFGVLLVPAIGPKFALLLVVAGYLALSLAHRTSARRAYAPSAIATVTVALALWAPPLAFIDVPEGGRVVSHRDGAMASVSVVEDAAGVIRLHINNRAPEGSSATLFADARQALLPLLLHPAPRSALFLGLGTGVSASAAAEVEGLHVDAVELLPEVIAASAHFTRGFPGASPNPRLRIIAADARRFVRASDARYDLIVADNFHPARSGSAALYTTQHFAAVRERLAENGLFCQWLPLHQLDLETLRPIVRAFLAAFPAGTALLATNSLDTPVLGLLSSANAQRFDPVAARARIGIAMRRDPAGFGLADEFAVLGSFIAGPVALSRFAGDAPINTDDRPVVAYRAPRITYVPDSLPRDRLLALLRQLDVEPNDILVDGSTNALARRLAAYWAARDRYLEIGRHVRASADVRRMLAQVRDPLLDVLRSSPDFRPAYDPLVQMASALATADPVAARALLNELAAVAPARPEAVEALRRINFGPSRNVPKGQTSADPAAVDPADRDLGGARQALR